MRLNKVKTYELDKCYSIAPLVYNDKKHILVAAEKVNKCLLFDEYGNLEETIWDQPGGTMSMVQVPNSNGQFLATHQFYSPNDSKEAKIVLVTPIAKDNWKVQVIAEIPFVHRFDIVSRKDVNYIVACALKSGHEYKDDWSSPGEVFVCELPKNLEDYKEGHYLPFKSIKQGLLKNHGYCRVTDENGDYSVIAADNGVFKFMPPSQKGQEWTVEKLIDEAASDMAFVDFDGDGELEMVTIAPFHGDEIKIYKKINGAYKAVFTYDTKMEFGHSIWAGTVYGKPTAIIGHRKGNRNIVGFTYDGDYKGTLLDSNVGSANVFRYMREGVECMVSTNREINEIAFYEIEQD